MTKNYVRVSIGDGNFKHTIVRHYPNSEIRIRTNDCVTSAARVPDDIEQTLHSNPELDVYLHNNIYGAKYYEVRNKTQTRIHSFVGNYIKHSRTSRNCTCVMTATMMGSVLRDAVLYKTYHWNHSSQSYSYELLSGKTTETLMFLRTQCDLSHFGVLQTQTIDGYHSPLAEFGG